jgi:hypothetical protein
MSEDERVKKINNNAAIHLQEWLQQLEDSKDADDLLASLYGAMVAAYLLGYSPDVMAADAKAGAERLISLLEETESICPNKDENGNCPLHNLHCTYPDCEKKG